MKEYTVVYNWTPVYTGLKKVSANSLEEAIEKVKNEEDEFIDEEKGIEWELTEDYQEAILIYNDETGEEKII
jgi:hypothetical protein